MFSKNDPVNFKKKKKIFISIEFKIKSKQLFCGGSIMAALSAKVRLELAFLFINNFKVRINGGKGKTL